MFRTSIDCLKENFEKIEIFKIFNFVKFVARQQNYQAMPLIIDALKSQSVVLSGRALAAAENLLGIRYDVSIRQLREQSFRNKISNMVAQDWKKLEAFPRFTDGLASP